MSTIADLALVDWRRYTICQFDMSQTSTGHGLSRSTESFLPYQPYRPLFESSSEVPQFVFPCRYWEHEVTSILKGYDAQAIHRLIRYGLFDDELPRSVLQNRNGDRVKELLLELITPQEADVVANLLQNEQVDEIIRRSRLASIPLVPWGWHPRWQDRGLGPQAIAAEIDAESKTQFNRIPFEEWVRYSLGYPVVSVKWFLQQHTSLYILLWAHLNGFPDEIEKYSEVEKVLLTKALGSF